MKNLEKNINNQNSQKNPSDLNSKNDCCNWQKMYDVIISFFSNLEQDYVITEGGKKQYWDDIESGTKNYLSLIATTHKRKLNNDETNKFLYEFEKMMGSTSSTIARVSYITALTNKFGILTGFAGHIESWKYSMVRNAIRDLNKNTIIKKMQMVYL